MFAWAWDVGDAGPYSHPHSFARTPTGTVLVVRSGRFWVQPAGTTGSLVVLDVSTPEKPVIADELAFGVDARPHWLALEPGGKRIVMTGGGTLAGGVYLIDMDPETGKLRLSRMARFLVS